MANVVNDSQGYYDLAQCVAVLKDSSVPPLAILVLQSGERINTLLDFAATSATYSGFPRTAPLT